MALCISPLGGLTLNQQHPYVVSKITSQRAGPQFWRHLSGVGHDCDDDNFDPYLGPSFSGQSQSNRNRFDHGLQLDWADAHGAHAEFVYCHRQHDFAHVYGKRNGDLAIERTKHVVVCAPHHSVHLAHTDSGVCAGDFCLALVQQTNHRFERTL